MNPGAFQFNDVHRKIVASLWRWHTGRVEAVPTDKWVSELGLKPTELIRDDGTAVPKKGSFDFGDWHVSAKDVVDPTVPPTYEGAVPELALRIDLYNESEREWRKCLKDLHGLNVWKIVGLPHDFLVVSPLMPRFPWYTLDGQPVVYQVERRTDRLAPEPFRILPQLIEEKGSLRYTGWARTDGKPLTKQQFRSMLSGSKRKFFDFRIHVTTGPKSEPVASFTVPDQMTIGAAVPKDTHKILENGNWRNQLCEYCDLQLDMDKANELGLLVSGSTTTESPVDGDEVRGKNDDWKMSCSATEAIQFIGRGQGTYSEIANASGLTSDQVKGIIRRAATTDQDLLLHAKQDIGDPAAGAARVQFDIRMIWPCIQASRAFQQKPTGRKKV